MINRCVWRRFNTLISSRIEYLAVEKYIRTYSSSAVSKWVRNYFRVFIELGEHPCTYYVIKKGEGGVSQMLKRLLLKRGGGGLRGHAYAIIFWKKLLHYFHAYLFWFVWYLIFLKLCTPQLCIIRHKPSSVRAFPLSKPRIANFRLGKSARQDF